VSESVALMVASPTPQGRSGRRVAAVVVVIVVGLAGGGFAAYRWLTGEHLFLGPGASESISVPAGHTIYVGLGPLLAHTSPIATVRVDLRGIHPRVTTNTSDATVTVLSCLHGTTALSLSAGGTATDPHSFCGSVEGFRPGTTSVGPPATGLLLAVTPHRAGTVEVDGAHLTYRAGIRSGSQHIGAVNLTVNTP
jgi:hypothetical protein